MRDKVFGFLIILFLLGSLAPAAYEIAHSNRLQSNREFELIHNFPTDFNFYLSRIRQGIEGNVVVREQYTSEPHQGSFIHIFYLFLGWLGAWVRVPWHRASDVYHVARIVFGGFLLVMIVQFCKKTFEQGRMSDDIGHKNKSERLAFFPYVLDPTSYVPILAFLLAVTASTWPKIVAVINNQVVPATIANITNWRFGGYMPWWSVMDSLQRITFIPHLLVGQALIIFLIMALSDEATMKKPGNWVFLGVIAFAEGIIFPPGLLFIIVTIGALTCLELSYNLKLLASQGQALRSWAYFCRSGLRAGISLLRNWILGSSPRMTGRVVVLILGLPSLIYLSLMTSFYPWKRLVEFDIVKPLPFDYIEYLKAVGPILPLGIIGLLVALKMRDRRMWPAAAWVLAWALLLFIFKFIPAQSPLRFSEMIPHVPLGVLTAYLCWFAFHWNYQQAPSIKHQIPNKHQASSTKYQMFGSFGIFLRSMLRLMVCILITILIGVGFGVMSSSFLWQKDFIDHKMRATYPLVPTGSYVMYPLKDFIAAIRYIQDATPSRKTIILSETTAGNYIPVYAGNTVYVGHANTVDAEAKEVKVKEFFSGRMKPDDAKAWMTRENLHWIFFGPQEKEDGPPARLDSAKRGGEARGVGGLVKIYPFLTEVYKNSFVTVYRSL
ncbi:MAG: hypothetical protein Q8L37_02880 [Candidatus Gottesmanbacteria bacterium]|nr:hypothetical protein [Candidatus Gottesmanbacteria bacterium]